MNKLRIQYISVYLRASDSATMRQVVCLGQAIDRTMHERNHRKQFLKPSQTCFIYFSPGPVWPSFWNFFFQLPFQNDIKHVNLCYISPTACIPRDYSKIYWNTKGYPETEKSTMLVLLMKRNKFYLRFWCAPLCDCVTNRSESLCWTVCVCVCVCSQRLAGRIRATPGASDASHSNCTQATLFSRWVSNVNVNSTAAVGRRCTARHSVFLIKTVYHRYTVRQE
jgi:hypothetical protein